MRGVRSGGATVVGAGPAIARGAAGSEVGGSKVKTLDRWRRGVLLASLALLLVACPTEEPGDGDRAPDEDTVSISGNSFEPSSLQVTEGATVMFVNEDTVRHTVTAGTPGEETGEFDDSLSAGDVVEIDFDDAGAYEYFCQVHPSMTGEIQVDSD